MCIRDRGWLGWAQYTPHSALLGRDARIETALPRSGCEQPFIFPRRGAGISHLVSAGCGRPIHPATKVSRTVRVALSELGSKRAIDCQIPRASRPPRTGTVNEGGATIATR